MKTTDPSIELALFLQKISTTFAQQLEQMIDATTLGLYRLDRHELALSKKYLSHAKLSGEELLCYVKDLVEFSQLRTGHARIHIEEIDFCELIESIRRQFVPLALSRSIDLRKSCALTEAIGTADAAKMLKIVTSLVRNAFRYTPNGGSVEISLLEDARSISIGVADTGPGLSPELCEKVFNIYQHPGVSKVAQKTSLHDTTAIGFGLSICKELLLCQGGSISLDQKPEPFSTRLWIKVPKS